MPVSVLQHIYLLVHFVDTQKYPRLYLNRLVGLGMALDNGHKMSYAYWIRGIFIPLFVQTSEERETPLATSVRAALDFINMRVYDHARKFQPTMRTNKKFMQYCVGPMYKNIEKKYTPNLEGPNERVIVPQNTITLLEQILYLARFDLGPEYFVLINHLWQSVLDSICLAA